MASYTNFEHPSIDWGASDLYKEFTRFKDHVGFVFNGPLSDLENKKQAGWLGTWIGQAGREIYRTFTWEAGESEDPVKVLAKFEAYIRPRKNKRIARHNLKQRRQTQAESFDKFLTDLRLIIMDCDYRDPDDILIDCIIDGVHDRKVQERLLDRGEALVLSKAIEICQQFETSKKQVQIVRGQDEDPLVTEVHEFKHESKQKPHSYKKNMQQKGPCYRCGDNNQHIRTKGNCPALGTTCSSCKKPNHWAKVCRARKSVHYVSPCEPESEDDILAIYSNSTSGKQTEDKWVQILSAAGTHIPFKIDTGAKCNTITVKDYQAISGRCPIRAASKVLRTYSNHHIHPVGTANIELKHRATTVSEEFQVVNLVQENVISGAVAESLGLLNRISSLSDSKKLQEEFPDVTEATGTLPGKYSIRLRDGAVGVIHPPRRQPAALKQKIIDKLQEMETSGHITKVDEPTEWVNSMMVVVKNDKIRICLDPKDLNKEIKREHHPMRTIEEIASEIPGSKVFSTLDAKSGFLQIVLDETSSFLTTFNTPVGRYRWLRLPFGISCAPEVYQRIMDTMLEGIKGAYVIIDDILVAAKTLEEHDKILKQVIERASSYNLRLNFEKTNLRQSQVTYVGHMLTDCGLKPDPTKVKAVKDMPKPSTKEDVRRFLGFITYLGKFLPNLSDESLPLREVLKADVDFFWEAGQDTAFARLKLLCSQCPVLKYFDTSVPVEVQCDASSKGLGAVLLQQGHPIAYASRALTDAETRYAQIEKEMLSIVFACKKFHCYIFGKETTVYNDHKPLEMIFKKPLTTAPMRLQRMLLAVQWYDLTVLYRKGVDMQLADTLSRAYLPNETTDSRPVEADIKLMVSITDEKYNELQAASDDELADLRDTIFHGWPDEKSKVQQEIRPYWDSRAELAVSDGIVVKGTRLVIPPSMRRHMLGLIHRSHLGIAKCKQRAREIMYWPSMNADIEDAIKNCSSCADVQRQQLKQPLRSSPLPDFPFQRVSTDIFEFHNTSYLIMVDAYSRFILVDKLSNLQSSTVINTMRQVFCRHGIPETLTSDCGSQFTSQEFQDFCSNWGIKHVSSSPYYQKANGLAERGVQTVKKLWKKGADHHLSLLDYNSTPLEGYNASPAQLLMGRRLRNNLPSLQEQLKAQPIDTNLVARSFLKQKATQAYHHDKIATKPLDPLVQGQEVRVSPLPGQQKWFPAVVNSQHRSPRSYVVDTGTKRYRRNRQHIRVSTEQANHSNSRDSEVVPAESDDETSSQHNEQLTEGSPESDPGPYTTRSGRIVRPRDRLDL